MATTKFTFKLAGQKHHSKCARREIVGYIRAARGRVKCVFAVCGYRVFALYADDGSAAVMTITVRAGEL